MPKYEWNGIKSLPEAIEKITNLQRENEVLRELADSFYNWTLINYPEDYDEYHKEVKQLKEILKEGEDDY